MGTFVVGAVVLGIVVLAARCVLRKSKRGECIGCEGGCHCDGGEHSGCSHGQHIK